MTSERQWVDSLVDRLDVAIQAVSTKDAKVKVLAQKKIPYSHEVLAYDGERPCKVDVSKYATDLVIIDQTGNSGWIPRVVIECKLDRITTHDALTYSAKASTHKQVHPYVRYGILIGSWGDYGFPTRLFRHGAYFDFMVLWAGKEPTDDEWYDLIGILTDEVKSSRRIQHLLTSGRSKSRKRFKLVHQPLKIK